MLQEKFASANQYCPDLDSDELLCSSICNFCDRYSDAILWGNQWYYHELLAVFLRLNVANLNKWCEHIIWSVPVEKLTHLVFWVTIFGEIIVWWVRSVLAGTSFRSFAVGDAFHLGAVHCYMYITWNFYDLFSLSSLLLTFENSVLLPGACKLTAEHNRL